MIDRCGVAILVGDRVAYSIAQKIQNGWVASFSDDLRYANVRISGRAFTVQIRPERLMVMK